MQLTWVEFIHDLRAYDVQLKLLDVTIGSGANRRIEKVPYLVRTDSSGSEIARKAIYFSDGNRPVAKNTMAGILRGLGIDLAEFGLI